MGYKNLERFEFFKLIFLIFKINVQILNILLLFLELIFKLKCAAIGLVCALIRAALIFSLTST
jgi:hypothetical protein